MAKGLPNLPTDALVAQHFAIEIGSVEIAQFSEVSGLASEVDVVELKENTPDGKPIIHKLPGAPKPPTITLKRAKNASKDLWDWHDAMRKGRVQAARKEGSVVLKDFEGSEVSRYNFYGAWISKLTTSTMKSGSNEVLMEEVTIQCEALERVS
jgi:phage tail-like protein